ncbi:MAG: rhodanese-like domain-containing protein [Candidatus Spechtbacteria bacterium]|nr:rhodanese-like domain-containing protein [Candidatus Spechtbacteria bacterium]
MEKFSTITKEDLKKKIDERGDFALIDVLGAMSYAQRHLPGAISIPGSNENFVAEVQKAVGGDKSKEVIVYCASFSCQASPAAAGKLADAGFTNVRDFKGGLADWEEGGYEFSAKKE